MPELTTEQETLSSFSLKKIPVSKNPEEVTDNEDKKYADRIQLLELSNLIDNWEQELLFSENGFFNLKGSEVRNKSKEFISELERFINSKMSGMIFHLERSKLAAIEMKNIKIENIKQQLFNHEQKELYEWEISVYNNAIKLAHDKAILYKNNIEIFQKALNNGINAIQLMAEREGWKSEVLKIKKKKFISGCCYDVIQAFIDEKDINFINYYNKYKEYLIEEQKDELEPSVECLKNNIIAYNWAVELFSYQLSYKENEAEIKNIKDKNLESLVRKYIDILKKSSEKNEQEIRKQEIDESWNKIISLLETEPEKSLLYIDLTKDKDNIKSQQEYIKQIINKGFIVTDKKKFCELINLMLNDFSTFQDEMLNKYRYQLSSMDFEFLEKIQNMTYEEYLKLSADYNFLLKNFEKSGINMIDKIYDSILSYRFAIDEYQAVNNKEADFDTRSKIVEQVLARILHK